MNAQQNIVNKHHQLSKLLAVLLVISAIENIAPASAEDRTYLCVYRAENSSTRNEGRGDVVLVTATSVKDAEQKTGSDFYKMYGPASSNGIGTFYLVNYSCATKPDNMTAIRTAQ